MSITISFYLCKQNCNTRSEMALHSTFYSPGSMEKQWKMGLCYKCSFPEVQPWWRTGGGGPVASLVLKCGHLGRAFRGWDVLQTHQEIKGGCPGQLPTYHSLLVGFISRGAGDLVQKPLISGSPSSTGSGVCLREHTCVYVYSTFSVMILAGKRARRSIKKIYIDIMISRPASRE